MFIHCLSVNLTHAYLELARSAHVVGGNGGTSPNLGGVEALRVQQQPNMGPERAGAEDPESRYQSATAAAENVDSMVLASTNYIKGNIHYTYYASTLESNSPSS